jgi:hypothetical protein
MVSENDGTIIELNDDVPHESNGTIFKGGIF